MIANSFPRFALVIVIGSLIILGACASTEPARFYLLHAIPDAKAEKTVATSENDITVGIGPVDFPKYLDRPQIVTRISKHELKLDEFGQWAEPLTHNFSRILSENLSLLLSTERIFSYPWAGSTQIDYQVTVEVTRFDGTPGDSVTLNTRWAILTGGEKEVLVKKKSSYSQPTSGQDYEALVSAKSQALADLSREIADNIKAISKR
jgi:hypothetical protein